MLHARRSTERANMPFMNKALSKEIMTATRLRNEFLKDRSEENKKKYSKQRNYCVSLLRKSKLNYFGNLNEKNINDNKTFWKTFNKQTSTNKMKLIDQEKIFVGDHNTAKVLNTFFSKIFELFYFVMVA